MLLHAARIVVAVRGGREGAAATLAPPRRETALAGGQPLALDVYVPPRLKGRAPALLMVPGVGEGTRDPRMRALAALAVRAGMVVAVPELAGLTRYELDPGLVPQIEAAFAHMAALPEADPARLSLFGTSVGGGLAVAAATRPGVAPRLHTLIAFAPYYDYGKLIQFLLTGRDPYGAPAPPPSPSGRRIVVYNVLPAVHDPADPDLPLLVDVLRRRIFADGEGAGRSAQRLSPRGREVLGALEADGAAGLAPLAAAGLARRGHMAIMSPHMQPLCALRGDLLLLHGRDDDVIPASHSVALDERCRACPELQCRLLLTGMQR
ncbi:MAG TPA: hypothetical protein VFO85_06630, partial [Vicinamibacteria bacterium]|nr:hypothetical protein [Vicinamibacteria bacterium]